MEGIALIGGTGWGGVVAWVYSFGEVRKVFEVRRGWIVLAGEVFHYAGEAWGCGWAVGF